MAEYLYRLLHNASASCASVKIKNATNPMIKILGCVLFSASVLLLAGDFWVKIFAAALAFIIVVSAIVAYFCLMAKDPHLLQSEEFQIQNKMLELVQGQGTSAQISLKDVVMLPDNTEGTEAGKE